MVITKDVAVVGVGYWGKNLARNYYELGALHTLCDQRINFFEEYKNQYPGVNLEDDYQKVLQNKSIRKVVIATPTRSHYEFAHKALLANKDVFVEKAMCSKEKEALKLVQLQKSQNQILMVGHLLNYHPAVCKIKEMVQRGDLGRIYHLSFNRMNFGSVGAETSALWAFAPHDISLLLSMTKGHELEVLSCRHKSFFSKDFVDQSWLHFEFSKDLSADIQVGWASPIPQRNFTVIGTGGMVVFDDLKDWDQKISLRKNQVHLQASSIHFHARPLVHVPVVAKEPLREECLHFLNCCHKRLQPITNGEEGLRVMKILEQAISNSSMKPSLIP